MEIPQLLQVKKKENFISPHTFWLDDDNFNSRLNLLKLQNGNIDNFIDECINSLIFKEIDHGQFTVRQFEEGVLKSVLNSAHAPSNISDIQVYNTNSSENFFVNSNDCFQNLVQFELESYDSEFDVI